jgi:hypothetical protein
MGRDLFALGVPLLRNNGRAGSDYRRRIGGVFLLRKYKRAFLERVSAEEAFLGISEQVVLPHAWSAECGPVSRVIMEMIGLGRVYRLNFTRSSDVTELVAQGGC